MKTGNVKINDDLLREAITASGYYEFDGMKADLKSDDLDYDTQVKLILARAVVQLRPDLKLNENKNVVFIVTDSNENGKEIYSLPYRSLTDLLSSKTTQPYDTAEIWTYDIVENKFLTRLYYGDGTKWKVNK